MHSQQWVKPRRTLEAGDPGRMAATNKRRYNLDEERNTPKLKRARRDATRTMAQATFTGTCTWALGPMEEGTAPRDEGRGWHAGTRALNMVSGVCMSQHQAAV